MCRSARQNRDVRGIAARLRARSLPVVDRLGWNGLRTARRSRACASGSFAPGRGDGRKIARSRTRSGGYRPSWRSSARKSNEPPASLAFVWIVEPLPETSGRAVDHEHGSQDQPQHEITTTRREHPVRLERRERVRRVNHEDSRGPSAERVIISVMITTTIAIGGEERERKTASKMNGRPRPGDDAREDPAARGAHVGGGPTRAVNGSPAR